MKFNLIKTVSFFIVLVSSFAIVYSVSSCSNDGASDSEKVSKETIDEQYSSYSNRNSEFFKGQSSVEYMNFNFVPQEDGSILRFEDENETYYLNVNTPFETTNDTPGIYKFTNSFTGEFIDILDIVNKGDYYLFNATTSEGKNIEDVKYYGDDLLHILEYNVSASEEKVCPPCIAGAIALITTVIESIQDSPMEQCRGAMPTNCPSGQSAYMNFNEGWFSTTCITGCR